MLIADSCPFRYAKLDWLSAVCHLTKDTGQAKPPPPPALLQTQHYLLSTLPNPILAAAAAVASNECFVAKEKYNNNKNENETEKEGESKKEREEETARNKIKEMLFHNANCAASITPPYPLYSTPLRPRLWY